MSVNIKTFTWHRENGWNLTHNSSHPIQASCTHEALINESTTYKLPNITPHLLSWSVCHFGPQTEIMITFLKTNLVSMCTSGKVKDSLFVTVIVKKILLHIYTDWKICYSTEIWKLYLNAHKKTFHVKEQNQFNTVVELALRPISTDIHWCSNITP